MAEIGVHHGRLFIALHLLRVPGEKSLAIDLFAEQAMNIDQSGKGDEQIFRKNVARHAGSCDDVILLSTNSLQINGADIVKHLGARVRFFSVDGGHTREVVQHDMRTAQESLVDGGVVIADDIFNESWPGVAEGTLRYLEEPSSLVPFAIGFNKVFFSEREYADEYRRVILSVADAKRFYHKESVMHDEPVEIVELPTLRYRLSHVPALKRAYDLVKPAYQFARPG
jgi:hypothetical protein